MLFVNILMSLILAGSVAVSSDTGVSENSPRALVHLLDYLAQDYAGAVANGKVISSTEYQEQIEFAEAAEKITRDLYKTQEPTLFKKITDLRALINGKASPEKVKEGALNAKAQVIQVSGLPIAPNQWPRLQQGAHVYAQNCIQCHGVHGDGQGPSAKGLNPPPINFFDAEKMEGLSPFQIFNAVRVGVPGTGMIANKTLSDSDLWSLAFYVASLRHQAEAPQDQVETKKIFGRLSQKLNLEKVSSQNDGQLKGALEKIGENPSQGLAVLRVHSSEQENSIGLAMALLDESLNLYRGGNYEGAKGKALTAYLEGVEPVEPRLRATDPGMTSELENKMAQVRQAIEARKGVDEVAGSVSTAKSQLEEASVMLSGGAPSPWLTFLIAAAILLREGFEAVLIVLALLGVVRAAGSRKAALWVHGGWIAALALGFIAWFFSGWLMAISGAQREMMEGVTSIFAVVVLLYMGFWLHRTTEIGRWTAFINGRVRTALEGGNLFGLAMISFVSVFRECFETVLFLRALWLEGGMGAKTALAAGVFGSLAFIIIASWIALRYTAKIPIRKLFDVSSSLMTVLAVILAGKAVHSLQETGTLGISGSPMNWRFELMGFYPTYETLFAQGTILVLALALWLYGKRPSSSPVAAAEGHQ